MTVYPIALALLLFAALLALRTGPIAAGGLLLPFGATAAMTVGSASLLVADIYFIAVGALMLIFGVILKGRAVVPKTFILPLVIAGFAILSALTLPFIFEGTPIYPTSFLSGRVTRHYYLVPLKFSSGNISQTIYLCLAMGYVMLFATVASRQPGAIHRLLIIAAITNLVVSIASIVSHELIAPFQTADYRVFEDAQISRLIRLTGTFPEASMYAEFTAPIGAYLVGHYFASGRALSLGLGLATLALAILSLSSTGIIAVSALAGFSLLYAIWRKSGASRIFVISFISVSAAAALVIVIPGTLNEVINTLIFEKLTSQSGLERSEWAERGFQVFIDTYFLGAGTGSVRSNGLLFVLLANLGLIGTLLVGALLWRALRRPSENAMLLGAAFALVTLLAAKMASQTTVAPGLLFAMLAGARLPVQRKIARGETRSPRNTGNGPVANGA